MTDHRRSIYFALLVLGAYAQVAQALLIREGLVVFYGNEVSMGAFFGSWLFWIALGSGAVALLKVEAWSRRPLYVVQRLLLFLPFLLGGQVLTLRAVRRFLDVPATEFIPLGDLFLSLFLITGPTSLALGLIFPLACKALRTGRPAREAHDTRADDLRRTVADVSHLYIVEALGALAGGVLFTFLLVEWFGVWRSLGLVTAGLAATSFLLGDRRDPARAVAGVLALAGIALALTPLGDRARQAAEVLRFSTLQPGLELMAATETRYGQVALGRLGGQYSVVQDGRISVNFPQPRVTEQMAAYYYTQTLNDPAPDMKPGGARRVLMFGGLTEGLAAELLHYPVDRLDVVIQDRQAFAMLRPYLTGETLRALGDARLHLHFVDGRRYLNRPAGGTFDLVLVLEGDPASAHGNRYFTLEFYRGARDLMAPEGILCTSVSSASNYLGRDVASYSGSVFNTLSRVMPHVAILPGDTQTYCGASRSDRVSEDPLLLERRYRLLGHEARYFSPTTFSSLLPREHIDYVRAQLSRDSGDLNTDAHPVTYYLNMVLWGKFSASQLVEWLKSLKRMGPWPYLVPLAVFTLLLVLRPALEGFSRPRMRRHAATFTLVVLGLIAMSAQLAILLAYQAHVGFMFGRIALLNGVFMTGLALGAGAVGQWLARLPRPDLSLSIVMVLVALGLVLLPASNIALAALGGLRQEAAYLGLSLAAGLLTGSGFPLGVRQAQDDTGEVLRSSGITEAADHLGGALGGLLTGSLLIPLLGVGGTCYLLAVFALLTLGPVLFAWLAPERVPILSERGHRAFPYSRLSWSLAFLMLSLFGLWLLVQRAEPPPQVQFSDRLLSEVSGSTRFRYKDHPMPYYLGWTLAPESENAPESREPVAGAMPLPETVTLSSIPVASGVSGFGGPLNLLISLDAAGHLQGARYIASHETPGYIEGIDAWLQGLSGWNLSKAPLSLERVDALSGATVTSRAALATINRTARAGAETAFGMGLTGEKATRQPAWTEPRFFLTLALVLLFFPVYRSGRDGLRLVYQGAALAILGLTFNSLVTEVDLANLTQGHVASLAENPQRWLLLGFVLVTAVLFGQAYCGYLCPFGAAQEFISRLGRWLYLRDYVDRPLETRVRYLKFLLLALTFTGFWLTGDSLWIGANPMQHLFGWKFGTWMAAIVAVSLAGALFYYRFWCRYFCPFGAFLSLSNKLALWKGFGPQRRFEHCDLGVRDEYDVDCIHCHRCVTGRDYGVRPRPHSEKRKGPTGLPVDV